MKSAQLLFATVFAAAAIGAASHARAGQTSLLSIAVADPDEIAAHAIATCANAYRDALLLIDTSEITFWTCGTAADARGFIAGVRDGSGVWRQFISHPAE